jgi:hypothetical protein
MIQFGPPPGVIEYQQPGKGTKKRRGLGAASFFDSGFVPLRSQAERTSHAVAAPAVSSKKKKRKATKLLVIIKS